MLSRSLQIATMLINPLITTINESLDEYSPTQIATMTLAGYLLVSNTYRIYQNWNTEDIIRTLKEKGLQSLTRFPVVGNFLTNEINNEIFSIADGIKKDVDNKRNDILPITKLPKEGWHDVFINVRLRQEKIESYKNSGAEYAKTTLDKMQLLKNVWADYAYTNPMHTQWTNVNLMEAEILSMCHELFNSPLNARISELEVTKKKLVDILEIAFTANANLTNERNELVLKQNILKENLKKAYNQEKGISILKELKLVKHRLEKINQQVIKADNSIRDSYYALVKQRVVLEKQVRNPGILTHGGSTSIFEATKAHVFRARERNIDKPIILLPETAHVSFEKSAEILQAKIVKIPINKKTGQVDLATMETAIKNHRHNIAMIVGSAPSFLYGIMDPIAKLGYLADKYDVAFHVDSCLGGFLTAFAQEAGINIPSCDFLIPGVSSISVDSHKYGQTPKGTSVLLFHPNCKASATHVHLDWPGGMYVTPGLDGSRSGADIATTWATLMSNGYDYYAFEAKEIYQLRKAVELSLQDIEGLEVRFPDSEKYKLNVIGIRAQKDIDLLHIEKNLKENGWGIQIMQTNDQDVDGLHFCLTSVHKNNPNFIEEFHDALNNAFHYARSKPLLEADGNIKIYGKMKKSAVPFFVQKEIGQSYIGALNTIRVPTNKP